MRYVFLYVIIGVSLSACSRVGLPAPVWFGTNPTMYSSAPSSANINKRYSQSLPGKGQAIRVKKGETVYHLSRLYNVNPRSLILTNRLRAPYHLHEGQRIIVPIQRTYTVKRGDTLYAIADKYSMNVHQIVTMNRISQPYTIKPGQKLLLPQAGYKARTMVAARKASSYSKPKPKWAQPQKKSPATRPLASGPGTFLWPLKGKLLSTYGPKQGGIHNDGINISGTRGQSITAARNGKVVYAGKDLESYGNMVLVQHDRGYITAYAHTDRIHVRRGDYVKRGQKIATVGSSGSVDRPQLHFEIRRGQKAIDPLSYLRRS